MSLVKSRSRTGANLSLRFLFLGVFFSPSLLFRETIFFCNDLHLSLVLEHWGDKIIILIKKKTEQLNISHTQRVLKSFWCVVFAVNLSRMKSLLLEFVVSLKRVLVC